MDGISSAWTISSPCGAPARLFIGGTDSAQGGTALLNLRNAGTVIVDNPAGQTTANVGVSGTLTGNGTFMANGPASRTTVKGTLAPIDSIKVVGDLILTNSATTVCNVTPSAADMVTVEATGTATGLATLNGRVSVNMTGDFSSAPTRFTLLHAEGNLNLTAFATQSITYPTGLGWTPQITYDYDGGNVYLDRVYDLNP